jgi:hypothetical protein
MCLSQAIGLLDALEVKPKHFKTTRQTAKVCCDDIQNYLLTHRDAVICDCAPPQDLLLEVEGEMYVKEQVQCSTRLLLFIDII